MINAKMLFVGNVGQRHNRQHYHSLTSWMIGIDQPARLWGNTVTMRRRPRYQSIIWII